MISILATHEFDPIRNIFIDIGFVTWYKYSPMILMEWDASTTGKKFSEHNIFNNILKDYKVIALSDPYPYWWMRNKIWSIRSIVEKYLLGRYLHRPTKCNLRKFDAKKQYENILLYKKEHQGIISKVVGYNIDNMKV